MTSVLNFSIPNTTAELLCYESFRLRQHVGIKAIHCIHISISSCAIFFNFIFIIVLMRHKALHRNLRIFLMSLSLSMLLYCFTSICLSSEVLRNLTISMDQNPCALVVSTIACWFRRFPRIVLAYSIGLSLLTIGIERIFASSKYETYETSSTLMPCVILLATKVSMHSIVNP